MAGEPVAEGEPDWPGGEWGFVALRLTSDALFKRREWEMWLCERSKVRGVDGVAGRAAQGRRSV